MSTRLSQSQIMVIRTEEETQMCELNVSRLEEIERINVGVFQKFHADTNASRLQ